MSRENIEVFSLEESTHKNTPEHRLWYSVFLSLVDEIKHAPSQSRVRALIKLLNTDYLKEVCTWIDLDHTVLVERAIKLGDIRIKELNTN